MTTRYPKNTWDPRSEKVQQDQLAAYDRMRDACPVAHSDYLNWSVFRHEDVKAMVLDHHSFSSRVSSHLSVPNGMDPPQHGLFRAVVDRYFSTEVMATFEPKARTIARTLVAALARERDIEIMSELGHTFALRCQSAFMGWPEALEQPLLAWVRKNHDATLARDVERLEAVASEFDHHIQALLVERRGSQSQDITARLLEEEVEGRPLSDEEIVSIIRNWTVGELGTIAAAVGIVLNFLANNGEVQEMLRDNPHLLDKATDEIQRLHDPLVSNRRIATCPVEVGGRRFEAGTRFTLMWSAANRDDLVFPDPEHFRLDRNSSDNLVYGAGIHVCPGAPLTRLELRVLLEELFAANLRVVPVAGRPAHNAIYPAGGYSELYLRLEQR